jgi:ComF family protein
MVYNWIDIIQQQLYPAVCSLCGSEGIKGLDLCASCRDQLPRNLYPCNRCALPLPVGNNTGLCGHCARRAPLFQRIYAPFLYQPPVDHLIRGLKFHQQLANSRLLGRLLADYLRRQDYIPPQLILPVPLHNRQLRDRGFNQSAELALQLARELRLDWSTRWLHKIRHTQPQHGLNQKQRVKNLRRCFQFDNPQGLTHVAVVDDVVTTGSTAREITRTLNQQGVETVQIWALARTP